MTQDTNTITFVTALDFKQIRLLWHIACRTQGVIYGRFTSATLILQYIANLTYSVVWYKRFKTDQYTALTVLQI